jgi:hypothetical protein
MFLVETGRRQRSSTLTIYFLLLTLVLVGLAACQTDETPPTAVPPTSASVTATAVATLAPTEPTAATETPPPSPTPLLEGQSPIPTRPPTGRLLDPQRVSIYPGPELYAGDQATFQFVVELPPDVNNLPVAIYVNGDQLVNDWLNWRNFANEPGGLYPWVWDTTGLSGLQEVRIVLDPDGRVVDNSISLEERSVTLTIAALPALTAPRQNWVTVATDCCNVHAIERTAAHRDIEYLAEQTEIAFAEASASLQEPLRRVYDVYFIDRVIGQGGYAASSLVISYLDRNYAGLDLPTVLHHEAVHLIDRQFAPNRIPFLAEGVAVWAAGGHYKPENVNRRAAALLRADLYIPLRQLADNFYPSQHEIGYLQAGSFMSYLTTTYGWTAARQFYAETTPNLADSHSQALDITLQRHFNRSLDEMEADWLAFLRDQRRDSNALADLETTIAYYETLRAYQSAYDSSAYFLTAWLPLPEEARERNITADFSRRPVAEINLTLETMLISAHRAMREGDYRRAQGILSSVNRVIESGGQFRDPLSQSYRQIVQAVTAVGYQPQTVDLQGNEAVVTAVRPPSRILQTINLTMNGQNWVIVR